MEKEIINSTKAPDPVGPYNHSVRVGNLLFISGQIALDKQTGELVLNSIEEETHMVMKNLGHILAEAGVGYEAVVKCSVFVKDMGMYGRINAVYATYFDEATAPARELVEVANLPKYVHVEVSAIAVVG